MFPNIGKEQIRESIATLGEIPHTLKLCMKQRRSRQSRSLLVATSNSALYRRLRKILPRETIQRRLFPRASFQRQQLQVAWWLTRNGQQEHATDPWSLASPPGTAAMHKCEFGEGNPTTHAMAGCPTTATARGSTSHAAEEVTSARRTSNLKYGSQHWSCHHNCRRHPVQRRTVLACNGKL